MYHTEAKIFICTETFDSYNNSDFADIYCNHILLSNLQYSIRIFRRQVENSRIEAEKDGVVVPLTLEEYCVKPKVASASSSSHHRHAELLDSMDFYDEFYDYGDDDDDENNGGDDCDDPDNEDSGQGES